MNEIVSLAQLMVTKRDPACVVSFCPSGCITWEQFQTDVYVLSQQLLHHSAHRWAICTEDSYLFAVAFMAAAHTGRHIILPGNLQPAALAELTQHFDAILHDNKVEVPLGMPALLLNQSETVLFAHDEEQYDFQPLNLAAVFLTLFTSGSSGAPKAIQKSLNVLDAELSQLQAMWGVKTANSKVVSTVSHQHIYGLLFRLLWPLCTGRGFARYDFVYPEQVMAQLSSDSVLVSSPALLKRLDGLPSTQGYRAIFSSGGPLTLTAAQQTLVLLQQLPIEVFGSTETGGIAYRQQAGSNTPWQAFPVVEIQLNAEQCLSLRSPFINPETWYQTADQCLLLSPQQFEVKGRIDRVIKVEEKRISLSEIEQRLCQLDGVDEAAVLPLEQKNRLVIAAVITLTSIGQTAINEQGKGKYWLTLRQALRQWIEPVGIPRRLRVVQQIPLNSQGKRLMYDLEQLFID
ncbi:AMP-binding protein [Photobacterium makurazakiensis]|uniref:AMP-binding protein n=1 Tax=Photobacterium makurazakiensis TaxID=2910234 RepID=UPI003D0F37C5